MWRHGLVTAQVAIVAVQLVAGGLLLHSFWKLQHVDLAYGLPLDEARAWGLYVSTSRGKTSLGIEEPAMFSEPGLFLVRPDGTLYWGNVSTMPFARPHFGLSRCRPRSPL